MAALLQKLFRLLFHQGMCVDVVPQLLHNHGMKVFFYTVASLIVMSRTKERTILHTSQLSLHLSATHRPPPASSNVPGSPTLCSPGIWWWEPPTAHDSSHQQEEQKPFCQVLCPQTTCCLWGLSTSQVWRTGAPTWWPGVAPNWTSGDYTPQWWTRFRQRFREWGGAVHHPPQHPLSILVLPSTAGWSPVGRCIWSYVLAEETA